MFSVIENLWCLNKSFTESLKWICPPSSDSDGYPRMVMQRVKQTKNKKDMTQEWIWQENDEALQIIWTMEYRCI